jgi:hypothetical protein
MGWISDLIGLSAGAVVYWAPRGYLYQGSLSSLSVAEKRDPTIVDGAWEIQSWGKLPDIQLSDYLRTAIF